MQRLTALLVAGALVVQLAPAGTEQKDNDHKDIQGTWRPTKAIDDGRPESDDELKHYQMIFKQGTFTVEKDGEVLAKGTFTLDASAKPRHINLKFDKAPNEDEQGKTAVGIYKLEGDTLTWCATKPGIENRPIDFTAKEGSGRMLVTLKKVK